jgi:electron transfer flavoprotein beta subunit
LNIIVCLKRVPQTADAEVRVDASGRDIEREHLTFDINEYDAYALEEAVLFKERYGGALTAISVGHPDSNDTLRIALAKGADAAVRVKAEDFDELDGLKTALLIKAAVKDIPYDIIFTGSLATDDGYSQVGVVLAQLSGIPQAMLVTKIEAHGTKAHVHRELEGGTLEHSEIALPAVIAIQTGINTPRYASLIAIRRAAKKEIREIGQDEIAKDDLKMNTRVAELFIPPVTKRAEILTGSVEEVSAKVAEIIKEKGFL